MIIDTSKLAERIRKTNESKGFYTPKGISDRYTSLLTAGDAMLGKLALVHSEISEATEAVRDANPGLFAEELADTIIRILDICAACQIDIFSIVEWKIKKNEERPALHGRKTTL